MVRDPEWQLYRTFLEVLRRGSLSAAARALGLTQPTVGRHVEALEADLGLSLFARSQAGLAATAQAQALAPFAEDMAAAAAAFVRAAEGGGSNGISGTVRITAGEVVGAEILPPLLAEIRKSHPAIAFELVLSNRMQNLLRRDADIAVRMVRPTQNALVVRKLGSMVLGLYAHRAYAERRGLPQTTADLGAFDLVGFDRDAGAARSAVRENPWIDRSLFNFRADNDLAQLAAVRAGLGIGAMNHILAARAPAMVRVLPQAVEFKIETWLAMHEDQRANPPVRATFDALGDLLAGVLRESAPKTKALGRRERAR